MTHMAPAHVQSHHWHLHLHEMTGLGLIGNSQSRYCHIVANNSVPNDALEKLHLECNVVVL